MKRTLGYLRRGGHDDRQRQQQAERSGKENVKWDNNGDGEFEELLDALDVPLSVRKNFTVLSADVKASLLSSPRSPHRKRQEQQRPGVSAAAIPMKSLRAGSLWTRPGQFSQYLQQEMTTIDIDRIHQLRILLRSESVLWVREFMEGGGIKALVRHAERWVGEGGGSMNSDRVLHELLLCVKAITGIASECVSMVLLCKMGEFIKAGNTPVDFAIKQTMVEIMDAVRYAGMLRDVLANEEEQLQQRTILPGALIARPYVLWCKEIRAVCDSVFWVFQYNANVIGEENVEQQHNEPVTMTATARAINQVPAGFRGGVEWEAMEYVAAHLRLINNLIRAATSTDNRNATRCAFRASGFEDIIRASLRKSNAKYYCGVWEEMERWVREAREDAYDVGTVVRADDHPPPAPPSSPRKKNKRQKRTQDATPPLLPALDFGNFD